MGNLIKVIILGIVEGITEWLPVSSTGHLILVENILHLNVAQNFKTMFEVVIQLGAILAVCVLYFRKLNPFSRSKTKVQKAATWILWVKVLIATIPAAVLGFLFDDAIDKVMGKPLIISVVLVVFGILFIVVENRTAGTPPRVRKLSEIDYKLALLIGLFQVIAMLRPGTSRSGITIVGGLLLGKLLYLITRGKINPLIGSAGVSAVPMAARVSQTEGRKYNPTNFLLMHAMGPNVAGVIGSAVAAGFLLLMFGN